VNGLDLFSGIGGITKALEGYVRPVAYCENDRYAIGVLLSRMSSGDLPVAPVWDDVRTLQSGLLPPIDIIYGGFPCQDISVAGKQVGLEGKRSGLFSEICRLAKETKAEWIFLENVSNIRTKGLGAVLKALAEIGYDCRYGMLSAADVGANHKRERWFLLAHSRCELLAGTREQGKNELEAQKENADQLKRSGKVADTDAKRLERRNSEELSKCSREWTARTSSPLENPSSKGLEGTAGQGIQRTCPGSSWASEKMAHAKSKQSRRIFQRRAPPDAGRKGWWESEPNVGRVAYGIPFRVDRLKCLGNSVVPAQAREAFERLMGLKGK
jgi:DNA (cytosine-5)-methyltransferase 1